MGYLLEVILLLATAVAVVPLFQYLRLGAVLGFLCAGALVGPSGLGFITHVDELRHFSELGVVFLLFIIGVELRPSRLWLMRRTVFGLGTLQVVVTGAALIPIAMLAGYSRNSAVLIGLGLALSSTAFVLQLLSERHELNSSMGRHSFAILLLQDLAVVPLLALVPLLSEKDTSVSGDIGLAIAEAIGILGLVWLIGRYLLKPLLHQIARHGTNEIFAASGVLLVLGTAYAMEHAGMSMAMGAFLAGLLIADSEYRHQILADIQPFRGFLLGLFFMAVGMSVQFSTLLSDPLFYITGMLVLIVVKSVVVFGLMRLFGLDWRTSGRGALLLAQGGEFAFILFGVGVDTGLLQQQAFSQLVMVVALSMAATPLLVALSDRYLRQSGPTSDKAQELEQAIPDPEKPPHVIIAGFGRVGRRIAHLLKKAGLDCVCVDRDPDKVEAGRREGLSVYFGDASRADVLFAAGADHAGMVIVTLDSVESSRKLVGAMRRAFPELPIYARAHDSSTCNSMIELGATGVVSENLEASLQLTRAALERNGFDLEQREALLQEYRDEYYQCTPLSKGE